MTFTIDAARLQTALLASVVLALLYGGFKVRDNTIRMEVKLEQLTKVVDELKEELKTARMVALAAHTIVGPNPPAP